MNETLASLFARYPPEFRPLAEPEPLGNAGGMSGARLWKFSSPRGPMAARAWPVGGRSLGEIETIHAWLNRANTLTFVPVPVAAKSGRTIHEIAGISWEIAPWMPGEADREEPPSLARVRSAFAALAAFHERLGPSTECGFSPGLAMRAREIEDLPQFITSWTAIVRSAPEDDVRAMALEWLAIASRIAIRILPEIRAAASLAVALQPVLRDARPDHLLFINDRVTGLVDFGAMGIDTVAADLARLCAEWIGENSDLREEAVSSYRQARPLTETEEALIAAFERSATFSPGAAGFSGTSCKRSPSKTRPP